MPSFDSQTTEVRMPLRFMFKTIVKVEIGPESIPFWVHKEIICSQSPFFHVAFNGSFKEAIDQAIKLPEDSPEVFEYFMQWLYTGSLAHEAVDSDKPAFHILIRLYILADKLSIPQLKIDLVSKFIDTAEQKNCVPNADDTHIVYEELRESSPMRLLVLDLFMYKKTEKLIETDEDSWHERFLRDLIVKLKKEKTKDQDTDKVKVLPPWKLDRCRYHEHYDGQTCKQEVNTENDSMSITSSPLDPIPDRIPPSDMPGMKTKAHKVLGI
ncbi:MAG: hypothetical protein M1834_008302 [Cirrosporium novae-zelandiae]|nr:MAG: hypothetical protein M1834_008302 [Cirrosporium novae-zelandiae]